MLFFFFIFFIKIIKSSLKSDLNDIRGPRKLMLLCAILQSALVQKIDVHSLHQNERAQISANQRNKNPLKTT